MTKRTFTTEAEIRNYKSKILLLPKKLLLEVNQLIDDGAGPWKLESYIKTNYKGSLGVPTPPTLQVYIDWYTAKKQLALSTGTVIEPTRTEIAISEKTEVVDIGREHKSILDSATDITNKKELLERLIRKCIQRMKHVEAIQEMEGSTASLEAVVGHYLREMHSIVQTQLKLSGELQEESNAHVKEMISANVYRLIQLFFVVVMNVAPDKADAIKEKFYEEIKNQQELADALKNV